MSDDFNETGFTEQQEAAILAALEAVGLKPGANRKRILFEIVTYLVDLHDNLVVRASEVEQRLKTMRRGLEAFLHAYAQDDAEGEVLKLHLDDQKMIPTSCAECARRERKDWEALVAAPTQVEGPGFSESDMHHQPDENPHIPERYVPLLLAAVRKAQERPIEQEVLYPAVTAKAGQKAFQHLWPQKDDNPGVRREAIQKGLEKVGASLDRLAQAVAEGGTLTTLLSCIKKNEDRRRPTLHRRGRCFGSCSRSAFGSGEKYYRFEGEAAVGKLFNGLICLERSGVPNGKRAGTIDTPQTQAFQSTAYLGA